MQAESPIRFIRRPDDNFYHPVCPVLYRDHDRITSLDACPFPTKTDTFEVVLFGDLILKLDGTFAVVEYTKSCGHLTWERISFEEHVKDFEHYGTKFTGASYSINDWQNRIERFRTILPCDVCSMVRHKLWIYSIGEADVGNSRKKHMASLLRILDYNYANWREFVDPEKIEHALGGIRFGAGGSAYKDTAAWALPRP